jgi:glycosyltransferase involved in cell wall biosynthesis
MISGAEAHRIGRALRSVEDWTSELIVVVNIEVSDGTEGAARQHGARVFREAWKGHVAQKNSAADKAGQPWILSLDADEVVSDALRAELLQVFSQDRRREQYVAFDCPRLSWFCGRWIRHGDWYPDRKTRLWRLGRARWTGVDPHDRLEVDGAVGTLSGHLQHFSTVSIDARLQKIIPFSDEFVRQHLQDGMPGVVDLAVRPLWRFVRAYFIRLGFLDGWQGFYIAAHTAFSTLVRYARLREARGNKSTSNPGLA